MNSPTATADTVTLKSGQRSFLNGRLLVWFSRGAASAVALKMAVEKYGKGVEALYCPILQEQADGARFQREVSEWVGVPIKELRSKEYPSMDINEVFERRRFIADMHGASCTRFLKREVRKAYQWPEDTHVFGYTQDETMPWCKNPIKDRVKQFERDNPELFVDWILVDAGIKKSDCYRIVKEAGIELPLMYRLGYRNNNCIGCVKGGAGYWNKIRVDFPEVFAERAAMSRKLGVRLVKVKGKRLFLDELPEGAGNYKTEKDFDCGPQCTAPLPPDEVFDGKFSTHSESAVS